MRERAGGTSTDDVLANAAAHWGELAQRVPGAPRGWPNGSSASAIAHDAVAGATAGLWRIVLPRHGDDAAAVSFVVKRIAPAGSGAARWHATADPSDPFSWAREALAYETGFFGDDRFGIRAAQCYLADRREAAIDLYLEDVRGEPATRWDAAGYALAAERLGRYQAAASSRSADAAWLRGCSFFEEYLARREHLYANAAQIVRLPAPYLESEGLRELGAAVQQLWEQRERALTFCAQLPATHCHNDFWSPNLFAVRTANEDQIVAIDLAYAGVGPPGHDPANLVVDAVMDFFVPAGDAQHLWDAVAAAYRRGLGEGREDDVARAAEDVMVLTAALKFAWLIPATFQAASDETSRELLTQRHGDLATFFRERSAALRFVGRFVERSLELVRAIG